MSTKRLLQAAVDLIAERGFERSTLADIGERAGYSRGLLTGRFGSKENLLWELLEHHFIEWSQERLDPDLDRLPAPEALEHVLHTTRRNVDAAPTHMRALYSILFESLVLVPEIRERVADLHRQHRLVIQRIVERGIDEGTVAASIDPASFAAVWVAGFRGIAFQWLLDPAHFDLDEALAYMASSVTSVVAGGIPARDPSSAAASADGDAQESSGASAGASREPSKN
jgi:AcrR family transcriptional regulator